MLKFIVSLFDKKLKVLEPRPLRLTLEINDPFGLILDRHNKSLSKQKRLIAQQLLADLMRIGSASRPPKDWLWVKKYISTSFTLQDLHQLNASWWSILQNQVQQPESKAIIGLEPNRKAHCSITKANLPAARGILWLNICLLKTNSVRQVLSFVAACQNNYPYCPETSLHLALAGIDMLANEPYFKSWQTEISYKYPNLLQGKVAKRLEMAWARRAS